ncbi:tyrosine-type recombinase/integrase [Nonomuraea sp. NPDC050790]|uniref:tyrosine-type recombinase/integrase n=1 Tax=Nonomuraea sp. NPDC050790 TaxID=3364371 RepID=UPI00378E5510
MNGNGFKRCKCRDEHGRELGARCPKLRRANGSWNPNHGSWYGKAEVAPGPDGKRIHLRLGGFATEAELNAYYDTAGDLLSVPDAGPDGHEARLEILDMIRAAHRKKAPLPEFEELHRKFQAGQPLRSMTFGEYWAKWRARRERLKDIRESTLIGYIGHHDKHFGEILDPVRLDRLYAPAVEQVFERIEEKNAALLEARQSDDPEVRRSVRGQRPTGPTTKQRIRATIRTVLSSAQREHLVTFNAAELVSLESAPRPTGLVWTKPRVEAFNDAFKARLAAVRKAPDLPSVSAVSVWTAKDLRPSPVMVWTPVQLGAFLDHAASDRLYALFHLVAFRGLRRGEACGARWVDFDWEEGVLSVEKQLTLVRRKVTEGEPKTQSSVAQVALDVTSMKLLRIHRQRQREEELAWAGSWQNAAGRIFCREDGSPLQPDWVSEHFERLAFAAGVPPIRLHDLRHGAATLSLAAGNDMKTTSAMLRHSSQAITSDTYTSVLPDLARSAAEASVALVPRKVVVGEASETDGPPSVSQLRPHDPSDSRSRRKTSSEG